MQINGPAWNVANSLLVKELRSSCQTGVTSRAPVSFTATIPDVKDTG